MAGVATLAVGHGSEARGGVGGWIIVWVEELIRSSPAGQRLGWLLDGLDGQWPVDVDADSVLSPTFLVQVPAAPFVSVMSEPAKTLETIRIVGLDVDHGEATARFRSAAGDLGCQGKHRRGGAVFASSPANRIPSSPTI